MMIPNLKSSIFFLSVILSAVLIVAGMAALNNQVTKIGLIELNGSLNEMNREESKVDYVGMVSKYKLHTEYYKDQINQQQFDKGELRVAMLISSYSDSVSIYDRKTYNLFSRFLLILINFFRGLLDKSSLSLDMDKNADLDLTLAYYYERNNYYEKALTEYDLILRNETIDQAKIPIILLHRGFCLALSFKTREAKTQLKEVIRKYNNQNAGFVAATLLQYIVYFEKEIQTIKESGETNLQKSEKLYKLTAYNDAIEILNTILLEDEEQREKIQYIKARCYEEAGDKEGAMIIYQEIINENPESELAKLSNSRILIIGTLNVNFEKLKELAVVNNQEIQDPEFTEMLEAAEQYEEVTEGTTETEFINQEIESGIDPVFENEINEYVDTVIINSQTKTTEPAPDGPSQTPVPDLTPVPAQTPVTVQTSVPGPTPVPAQTPVPDLTPVPAQTPVP
ncbi:MAG: tetratricopeptide repeat protein, partial [Spirochaetales bacterium]|nr:tetratricopeptide repeat protein [Spirochaetales bacterium]